MRKTTKFLTLVLAVIMVASMFVTGTNAAFEDVDYSTAEGEAISLLVSLGVAKGTSEDKFGVDELVTRQQMAAFIYRLMKAGKQEPNGGANTTTFTDLVDAYYNYTISWANNTGVINGVSATRFNPTGNITLRDAYAMVTRAMGYDEDYPIGVIEKAEELGLDENLPSDIAYTDELTRGEVAIILANAFYADMASFEEVQERTYTYVYKDPVTSTIKRAETVEQIPADATEINSEAGPTKTVKKYDTIASDIFDVEKITQYVVATPSYSWNGADREVEEGVDYLVFGNLGGFTDEAEDETIELADYVVENVEFATLGLEGKADDYFMSGIELYVRITDDDERVVLGANALLNKKTVSGEDVTIGTLTGTSVDKYYSEDVTGTAADEKEYKMMNGLLTIDGQKTYIYNAPYSYAKPEKLEWKNDYNAKFITLGAYDAEIMPEDLDEEDELEEVYTYNLIPEFDAAEEAFIDWENEKNSAADAEALYNLIKQAYLGGFYELDTYDVDGDGLVDFIDYRPYVVAEIDDTEEAFIYTVDEPVFAADDVLFIDRTIVKAAEGVEYADKDIVLAYVNKVANYAKVAAVLEGTETSVKVVADKYVKFASGEKHNFKDANAVVANASLPESFNIGVEDLFYFYNNKLVYTDAIGTDFDLAADWVVVLENEPTEVKVMNEDKIETYQALTIYHDGAEKAVKVKKITIENRYEIDEDGKVVFDENGDPVVKKAYKNSPATYVPKGIELADYDSNLVDTYDFAYDFSDYVGELATTKTDAKGAYYFELATEKYADRMSADAAAALQNKDDDCEYMYFAEDVTLTKSTGNTFAINNSGDAEFTKLYIRDYTTIIVRSQDEDDKTEYVYNIYDAENLPNFDSETVFDRAQVVVKNYLNSSDRENLAVIYLTIGDVVEEADGKAIDYRVVLGSYESEDEDGESVYFYRVLNTKTGEIETDVEGSTENNGLVKGALAAMLDNGKLSNETEDIYGNIFTTLGIADLVGGEGDKKANKLGKLGYIEVVDYDDEAGLLTTTASDYEGAEAKDAAIDSYYVTDSTKIYHLIQKDEGTLNKNIPATALEGKLSKYFDDADKDGDIRVFVMADLNTVESDEDVEVYDATTIIILTNK